MPKKVKKIKKVKTIKKIKKIKKAKVEEIKDNEIDEPSYAVMKDEDVYEIFETKKEALECMDEIDPESDEFCEIEIIQIVEQKTQQLIKERNLNEDRDNGVCCKNNENDCAC